MCQSAVFIALKQYMIWEVKLYTAALIVIAYAHSFKICLEITVSGDEPNLSTCKVLANSFVFDLVCLRNNCR